MDFLKIKLSSDHSNTGSSLPLPQATALYNPVHKHFRLLVPSSGPSRFASLSLLRCIGYLCRTATNTQTARSALKRGIRTAAGACERAGECCRGVSGAGSAIAQILTLAVVYFSA